MAVPEEIEQMIAAQVPHFLDESTFLCELCDQPWPCPSDQQRLLGDFAGERPLLNVFLVTFLEDAMRVMPDKTAGEVHDQILGWVPQL